MKKIHIAGIAIIAIAIGVIITSLSNNNTYANFTEASANEGSVYHVVGKLDKSKDMVYNPQENPNQFTFYMKDDKGVERKVILHKSKPQDFERSEQIVLIGEAQGADFVASDVLMKCPSKYNDGKPQEASR
ncbi:MAG: cytochrome c maturation protein CcmE [Bacteroidia bacterium]